MAVAFSHVTGWVSGNKKCRIVDLTFSGNYATGGETVTPTNLRLGKKIEAIVPMNPLIGGVAGTIPTIAVAADGQSATIKQSEDAAGAAGVVVGQEKTNAEAYVASSVLRVLAIGY